MDKKILVVDDSKFMRMTLKKILAEIEGVEVVGEGKNGKEALDLFLKHDPDLITMDFNMPEWDGIKALKKIHFYDRETKVIMCSAMGQEAIVSEAKKYGASDFLVKPFNEGEVMSTIKKHLSSLPVLPEKKVE